MALPSRTPTATADTSSAPRGLSATRRLGRRLLRVAGALLLLVAVMPPVQCLALRWIDPPVTLTMLARAIEHRGHTGQWRLPDRETSALSAKPAPLPSLLLASEDRGFARHRGFDWVALRKAWHRYRTQPGANLHGGSTLSQQVSRNVFLWQHRSWLRKGLEAWYTLWLEMCVDKARILEVYSNVAELGPMTFGFEAGARHWFGKPLGRLSRLELASLVAMLPAPNSWTPKLPRVGKRARWIAAHPVKWPP